MTPRERRGLADLSLGPLGYRAESLSIANLTDLFGHPLTTLLSTAPTFFPQQREFLLRARIAPILDRKSTRLNSSHSQISYAVFCLKKKKTLTLQARLILRTNHHHPRAYFDHKS